MQMLSLPVITIAALSSLQTSIRLVSEPGPAMYAICLSVSRFSLSELATRHNYPEPLKNCHCVHTDHISSLSAVSGDTESDCGPRAPQSDRGTRAKLPGIAPGVIMD